MDAKLHWDAPMGLLGSYSRLVGPAVLLGAAIPVLLWTSAPAAMSAETARHGTTVAAQNARRALSPARRAARAIAAINARFEHCFEVASSGPGKLPGTCHGEAVQAYEALLRPAPQKPFDKFLLHLFDPLYWYLTHGEEAEAYENVVTGSQMDLARMRAAILTGADRRAPRARRGRPSLDSLFRKVPDIPLEDRKHVGRDLRLEWVRVRNADCAAYPVPRCAVRLDAALAQMLDGVLNDK